MPAGYWAAAWTTLWQSTLTNAAIATLAYWFTVSLNDSSFFMPFETLFMFAFIGAMAMIAATVASAGVGIFSHEIASWVAFLVWAAIYFGCSRSTDMEMQEIHKALGSASGLIYPLIAAVMWWRSLGLSRSAT